MKKIVRQFSFVLTLAALIGLAMIYSSCENRLSLNSVIPNSGASIVTTTSDSVLQYHKQSSRAGVYVDAAFTKTAAASLQIDPNFSAAIAGPIYSQPLFLDGNGGQDLMFVTTEQDHVIALDAHTGTVVWNQTLGTPVPLNKLPCGNINPLGITGTPVIDPATHTLYVDEMTTPDAGVTIKHMIYALSTDDGTTRTGWPVDVAATVKFNNLGFTSSVQNQRGALLLLNQTLYVPYGGHFGDCGSYHGWVVAVPLSQPTAATGWATTATAGGIWAPSGVASDGTSIFAVTGNTEGASTWSQGESVLRFSTPVSFGGLNADYFAPTNWASLDSNDLDLGGSGIVLFNTPGAMPSALAMALGKDGNAYLLDQTNLGGISNALNTLTVSSTRIISSSAAYTTSTASYVAFNNNGSLNCPTGQTGDLMAVKISATTPPQMSVAWCALQNGKGAPIVTTVDGANQFIVWSVGAENDNKLHGFDGDMGQVVFAGGGAGEQMGTVEHFQTPVSFKGHIYVPSNTNIYSFTTP